MADTPPILPVPPTPTHPALNPVLRLRKESVRRPVSGGGKSSDSIVRERLDTQREVLAAAFDEMARNIAGQPKFGDQVVVYAAMFENSLAPSYTPSDLFQTDLGACLVTPYRRGYLIQIRTDQLEGMANRIRNTEYVKEMVDISRVESVEFLSGDHIAGASGIDMLWDASPQVDGDRFFTVWFTPLKDKDAGERLIERVTELRDDGLLPPPSLLEGRRPESESTVSIDMRSSLLAEGGDGDMTEMAMRNYRRRGHSRTTVRIESKPALAKLLASGTVFRIDPVAPATCTAPGEGREPDRPLPADLSLQPVVGVVDGGLTAESYMPAVAWRAQPPWMEDRFAASKHGNQVTSLVVQGHDWNNSLRLPSLNCRVGTVQAVAKDGTHLSFYLQEFTAYLDKIMDSAKSTRVWNFSFNQKQDCPLDMVSALGHDIAMLARKHSILPIISIGNKPGEHLQPPADCEAAITVGGRQHDDDGNPAGDCGVSLNGPGPSSMLKPDLSHFSTTRVIGGAIVQGSSYATSLVSPLAAHTMDKLRDASPDLVKTLLIHHADLDAFDPKLGFGTPDSGHLPWECKPGFVTLLWTEELRPGGAYYWELPIPDSLREDNKIKGIGALTAVLNPHPMVSDIAGMNYFSARLEAALQFERRNEDGESLFHNLLGSLSKRRLTEQQLRELDHKWSPVRNHRRSFVQGVKFDGDNLRVYARLFCRDLYLHDMASLEAVPPLTATFVLSVGTEDENNGMYIDMREALGTFVSSAVVESDIGVELGSAGE